MYVTEEGADSLQHTFKEVHDCHPQIKNHWRSLFSGRTAHTISYISQTTPSHVFQNPFCSYIEASLESICFTYMASRPEILILTFSLRLMSCFFFSKCLHERRIQYLSIIHMLARTALTSMWFYTPTHPNVVAALNRQGEKYEELWRSK